MPNSLAKKCAISLQSFANGCIACNGEFPFPAPGPVDLPALCAVPGIAQKRQKNAEGLGRRSAFFLGCAAERHLPLHVISLDFACSNIRFPQALGRALASATKKEVRENSLTSLLLRLYPNGDRRPVRIIFLDFG